MTLLNQKSVTQRKKSPIHYVTSGIPSAQVDLDAAMVYGMLRSIWCSVWIVQEAARSAWEGIHAVGTCHHTKLALLEYIACFANMERHKCSR